MEAQGIDPRETSLEIGIFGAEPWTEEMREEVQRRTNIRAVDIYGLSEVMGPGVAQEAGETQDGLHIWEDHFYPEIVDPVTGEVLPDGEEGELVFTSLTKQAMPVIRYRTRDLTPLLPGTAYPPFRRMAEDHRPQRRHDDRARRQRLPHADRGAHPRRRRGWRRTTCACSPGPGRMDELTVRVEASAEGLPERAAPGPRRATCRPRVKHRVGVTIRVEVLEPHALERSLGKARRIDDQRHLR